MNAYDVLQERGFIAQVTFEEDLKKRFDGELTFYVGFDPTADSLHIGHYIPIMAMAHLQRAGHRPIALMGGGTGMVGDPSGKTDLRQMMTPETIQQNVDSIQTQMSRFLDFSKGKAKILNNADWLMGLNYIGFLREVGAHFSVNRMLTAECYKQRLEKGLTFLEFNYMLMQSYDFLVLHREHGCTLQLGGDDQWSNILAGADLIRRKEQKEAFALTCKLLLTHDGRKMGKTEAGALWLSAERTPPYDFYQYFRNVDDRDVEKCLALLTFLPMDEVRKLGAAKDAAINESKAVLAYEVTKLVHGEAAAEAAQKAAQALFAGGADDSAIPQMSITQAQWQENSRVIDLMALCGLAGSKSEARRVVQQGGVQLNGKKVTDVDLKTTEDDFEGGAMIQKGKKGFFKIMLEN